MILGNSEMLSVTSKYLGNTACNFIQWGRQGDYLDLYIEEYMYTMKRMVRSSNKIIVIIMITNNFM